MEPIFRRIESSYTEVVVIIISVNECNLSQKAIIRKSEGLKFMESLGSYLMGIVINELFCGSKDIFL